MEPHQPPLPRPPGDAENLRRLREEAVERTKREESMRAEPRPVYGGPPIVTRRWTLRGALMLIVGALAAIAAALWGYHIMSLPAYGGPPAPQPSPRLQPPAGSPQ